MRLFKTPPVRNWLRAAAATLALLPSLTLLATPPAWAQEASPPVRPALWKVADEDTTIWLFGTIHILPGDVDWYTGPVAAAFDDARQLVTEIAIDDDKASRQVVLRKSRREDGRALRDTLGPDERASYDAALASLGIPAQQFDGNDAWFAALMLTLLPLQVAGYNPESGVDSQVGAMAKARGMANHPLETAEYQIGLFDALPERTQQRYLDDVVEALPTVRADVDAMVAAWKAGDADRLAELMNEAEADPDLSKVLITDRNVAWAQWLKARLDRPGTVFVAVGAGHLAGPGSVQDQLARAGVTAVRVQ